MKEQKSFVLDSEEELDEIVAYFVNNIDESIVLLEGDLGTGKTTFVKRLLSVLSPLEEASSPTFSLVNEYLSLKNESIYHMDLYRLENIDEALGIGIEEYLDSGNLCLIEWPEIIIDLLPHNCVKIQISIVEDDNRQFTISKTY